MIIDKCYYLMVKEIGLGGIQVFSC